MKTTTQKAEGLLNTPGLSQGEKQFLQSILEFLEQSKDDPKPDVALAARKWDRAIGFFLKVRLRRNGKGLVRQNAEVRTQGSDDGGIPASRVKEQASRLCYPEILKEAA